MSYKPHVTGRLKSVYWRYAYIHFHYGWEIFHYGNHSRRNFIYLEYSPSITFSIPLLPQSGIVLSFLQQLLGGDKIFLQAKPTGIRSYLTVALGNSKSERWYSLLQLQNFIRYSWHFKIPKVGRRRESFKSLHLSLFLEPAFRRVIIPL